MNYIYYHVADLDGHCSGAEVALYLSRLGEKYKFVPFNYGYTLNKEELLNDPHSELYLVDISFSPDDMLWIKENCHKVTWIDHHISAINLSKEYRYDDMLGLRSTSAAACVLVYRYLELKYNDKPINYIGNWDIWDHSDNRTVYFQYGMRQYETDPQTPDGFELWKRVISHTHADDIPEIIKTGKCIYDYEMRRYKFLSKSIYEILFEEYRVLVINSLEHNSKIFDNISNLNEYDFVIVYNYNGHKKKYRVSFYTSKPDIDVSQIAIRYGGGGHKGAAGCEMEDITPLLNHA